jgi:hypothetical protein
MRLSHVDATWPLTNDTPRSSRRHNFDSKLGFGRVYSHWKSLGEKKEMVPLFEELKEVVGRIKIYTPSIKRVLRGWVCEILVSEKTTTLGLLGLMKESNTFIFLRNI